MIGVRYIVLEDFPNLGIDEVYSFFIEDTDLKTLTSDDFIINYMLEFIKNQYYVKSGEKLAYLGKNSFNGRYTFEILGNVCTITKIRRHKLLYVESQPCVEVHNGYNKMYIRLNTEDIEDYINPFIIR